MITYWKISEGLEKIDGWTPYCWTQVTCATETEQHEVVEQFGIPDFFLEYINDADEQARYDSEDGWSLVIMRIPYMKETRSRTPYITVTLAIVYKGDALLTICNYHTAMLDDMIAHHTKRRMGFTDYTDLIFRLFLSSSMYYLKYLRQINTIIEKAKYDLDNNIDNKCLIALSRLQDSLTYFETSIRGNESLLAKLKYKLPVDAVDADLIEDVNIEMSQAKETTQIYSTILDSTMDTYSSIINNNMNNVMRVLTSVSIILMLPTLIASFFGMNLINGIEEKWWGFPLALICSFLISAICWLIFRRKKLI